MCVFSLLLFPISLFPTFTDADYTDAFTNYTNWMRKPCCEFWYKLDDERLVGRIVCTEQALSFSIRDPLMLHKSEERGIAVRVGVWVTEEPFASTRYHRCMNEHK